MSPALARLSATKLPLMRVKRSLCPGVLADCFELWRTPAMARRVKLPVTRQDRHEVFSTRFSELGWDMGHLL